MELMEGVEEIPDVVLADGLTWDWETFPEFLDALERRPRAIDIAAQLEGDTAVLKLADPGSPTLLSDKEAKGALYVLMPMRV